MLDCFNEGFSDEDQMAATFTIIPRVVLNFHNAHKDTFRPIFQRVTRRRKKDDTNQPIERWEAHHSTSLSLRYA